jgi:signal peptide peptidase SppA
MKNYTHILAKVMREPWMILPSRHEAILTALDSHMAGPQAFQDDEDDGSGFDPGEEDEYREDGDMAIIPVHGILGKHLSGMELMCGGCSLDLVEKMIGVAVDSPRISKIMFHINSPGGTVTGIPELGDKIAEIEKPTCAFTDDMACSAALWLASQADSFYSTRSATVGSCGVYCMLLDYTKALETDGVKVNAIYAGKYKLAGAYFKALTPDEREMFQANVDKVHEEFKGALTQHRKIAAEFLEGQWFDGDKAAEIGMTDSIVTDFDEAMELLHDAAEAEGLSLG